MAKQKITPLDAWIRESTGLREISGQSLGEYHFRKLGEIVDYAKTKSRFYRARFAGFGEMEKLSDFQALPFTTPLDVLNGSNDFLCVPPDEISRIVTLRTSGTTGKGKRIFFTREDQELTVDFFECGMSTFTARGDRTLIFLPGETPGGVGDLLKRGLGRLGAHSDVYGPISDHSDSKRIFLEYSPDVVVGLPSQMFRLSAETAGGISPKSVLLASDNMPRDLCDAIRRNWKCEVFTHYGLTETGLGGAVTCAADAGYHMRENDLYFEIVDPEYGRPVPDGEYGEIVITTLNHRGMPLIRYRTGDASRILTQECECGSALRRLEGISGRINEPLQLRSGQNISIKTLDDILYGSPGVLSFSAYLADDAKNGGETLVISITQADRNAAMPAIPELDGLPVKVVLKKGEQDFFTTGVAKRRIEDRRKTPPPA